MLFHYYHFSVKYDFKDMTYAILGHKNICLPKINIRYYVIETTVYHCVLFNTILRIIFIYNAWHNVFIFNLYTYYAEMRFIEYIIKHTYIYIL